jgi:heterodisulfide reductase subunit A
MDYARSRRFGHNAAGNLIIYSCITGKEYLLHREVRMPDKPIGSVMVVGGGIAGIQASLDLADSGYYVYLVEKSPGVGGVMSQLDKTFPTNDCAM